MSFLDEEKRAVGAASALLALLERPDQFNELFARYRDADGLIDGEFLNRLPAAREVWRRAAAPETAAAIVALPLAFREAVLHGLRRDQQAIALAACLEATADKALQKRLKKLLYELKQEGVEPPAKPKTPLFRKDAKAAVEPTPCFVTNVDARNERVIVYHEPIRFGVRMLHVFERDGDLVFDFIFDEASRRRMREFLDHLRHHPGSRLFEVPADFAFYLLQKLRRRADEAGHAFPQGFLSSLTRLERHDPPPERHPYHDVVDGAAVLERLGALEPSESLLDEPELTGWQIEWEAARSLQLSLDDMQSSGLLLDANQREAQIAARIAKTIETAYGGPRRAAFAERLRDIAWLLGKRGAAAQAETAAALALALDDPHRELATVPFFRKCLAKVLRIEASSEPAAEDRGGLIV